MPTDIRAAVAGAPHQPGGHTDVIVRDQLDPLSRPKVGGHEGAR